MSMTNGGPPAPGGATGANEAPPSAQRARAIHQGSLVREPERAALAAAAAAAAAARSTSRSTSTPSRWPRPTISRWNSRSKAAPSCRASFLFGFDLLYAGVFRIQNVPQDSRACAHHDRVPAPVVPVRARDSLPTRGAQRRLPAADDRSGGFRVALSPEHGRAAAAGRAAAGLGCSALTPKPGWCAPTRQSRRCPRLSFWLKREPIGGRS